ncbi:hypothetical protein D3C87_1903130 [compost metagenome]
MCGVVELAGAGDRIAFRHLLEDHRIRVHPDAEDALLLAHGGIVARAFERDDDVIAADREQ